MENLECTIVYGVMPSDLIQPLPHLPQQQIVFTVVIDGTISRNRTIIHEL